MRRMPRRRPQRTGLHRRTNVPDGAHARRLGRQRRGRLAELAHGQQHEGPLLAGQGAPRGHHQSRPRGRTRGQVHQLPRARRPFRRPPRWRGILFTAGIPDRQPRARWGQLRRLSPARRRRHRHPVQWRDDLRRRHHLRPVRGRQRRLPHPMATHVQLRRADAGLWGAHDPVGELRCLPQPGHLQRRPRRGVHRSHRHRTGHLPRMGQLRL